MSVIHLPQRFTTLPQYRVRLSPAYQNAEVVALLNMGGGKDIAKGNDLFPLAGTSFPARVLRNQGYSQNFNGSQYIETTRAVTLSSAFTAFAWVRPDTTNSGYARILETAYNSGFYLGSNTGTQYAFIVNNSTLEGCIGGQQVAGQRDFILGVYDNGTRYLYVNGVLVDSDTATTPSSGLQMRVGLSNAGGSFSWTGDIDTVGLFNRAFTAKEVASLYANMAQIVVAEPRRLYAVASSFNSYTITPSGGVVFAGTNNLIKGKVIVPSGGIVFSGTNPITGTRSYPITPSGGITFGGTGSMVSSNAQTYIITPTGGVTFSGSATLIKTNIVIPLGGIVFSGSAPMTSNTVISTVTTRLPMTGAGS